MNARKPGGHPAHSAPGYDADDPRIATPADSTVTTRRDRILDGKNLKWLKPYQKLGYTFARNSHIHVRDPEGRLAASLSVTPSTRAGYRAAQAQLRRHERGRCHE